MGWEDSTKKEERTEKQERTAKEKRTVWDSRHYISFILKTLFILMIKFDTSYKKLNS